MQTTLAKSSGSATSFCTEVINNFNKYFRLEILGRREGFVSSKQMLEEGRAEDLVFRFRRMNPTELKIYLLGLWYAEDEFLSFLVRESLEKELDRRGLTIEKGRTEFLPYLISKKSATKAFFEEFSGKERKVFGSLLNKDPKGKYLLPVVFVRVLPKNRKSAKRYSGYCRGYKSSTPAKKNPGENLVRDINISWNRKRQLYNLLFKVKFELDAALLDAGFTDNYEQIPVLVYYKKRLEYELLTL